MTYGLGMATADTPCMNPAMWVPRRVVRSGGVAQTGFTAGSTTMPGVQVSMNMDSLDMSSPDTATADPAADTDSVASRRLLAAAHSVEAGIRPAVDTPRVVRTHPAVAADTAGPGAVDRTRVVSVYRHDDP